MRQVLWDWGFEADPRICLIDYYILIQLKSMKRWNLKIICFTPILTALDEERISFEDSRFIFSVGKIMFR